MSTSKGAEGLDVRSGEHLLVADDPESFAQDVLRLLEDEKFHNRIAGLGYELVRTKYGWETIGRRFVDQLERLVNEGNVS